MVTVFNRKELKSTFDIKALSHIKEALKANDIDYYIKTVNRNIPSPIASGSRARMGTLGENLDFAYEYIIFVKKEDYDKAVGLMKY